MYLNLDGKGERYLQLLRALKAAILEGRVRSGERLPATRVLSVQLGLSRNTVLAAYELLRSEQLAVSRGGSGTYVAQGLICRIAPAPVKPIDPPSRYAARLRNVTGHPIGRKRSGLRVDMQYGEPLTDLQLFSAWARSMSHAAKRTELQYPTAQGLPQLREQISSYLARRRGITCDPDDILVVNGSQQAMSLIGRVLIDEGESVVLEDPHYPLASLTMKAHGAAISYIPVDDSGLDTSKLPEHPPKLVIVTPSHQFPLGVTMSVPRRVDLLQRAGQGKFWVLEDDYDGEFGFEGRSLPAMRSLDVDDRVIYVGSFSKTIFPAMRLGYIVCPKALKGDLVRAKLLADLGCSGVEQTALAHFMACGAFERHLRKSAVELRRRRRALRDALTKHCGERIQLSDSGAGMHFVVQFPDLNHAQLEALCERAELRGLGLHSIQRFYSVPPQLPGLVLGYAGTSVAQVKFAAKVFGECLRTLEPTRQAHHLRTGVEAARAYS